MPARNAAIRLPVMRLMYGALPAGYGACAYSSRAEQRSAFRHARASRRIALRLSALRRLRVQLEVRDEALVALDRIIRQLQRALLFLDQQQVRIAGFKDA